MELDECLAKIKAFDHDAEKRAEERWLTLVKPLFSLGRLEKVIIRMAGIKGREMFSLENRTLVIMCADNGVVDEGISQCGREVTATAAKSFVSGTSAACLMAKKAGVDVLAVDAGMAVEIEGTKNIKTARGTKNIAKGPAMTAGECRTVIERSIDLVGELAQNGCEMILTGEMGIGNTTTASAVTSVLLDMEPSRVTGRGAGLTSKALEHKIDIIGRAIELNRPDKNDAIDVLSKVGGFDIAGMAGLFIGGAVYGIPVVMDGFISSAAALAAVTMDERVRDFIIPSHLSDEPAAYWLMDKLGFEPFITCGMFLGEGSGAVAVVPLLDMALEVYRGLGTFDKWEHEAYRVLR